MVSAAGLALWARTEGLTAERVDQARLRDRSIVLTWAMRGTLHLIASDDHGWLVPLTTEPSIANAHRRLKQEGMSSEHAARALRLIEGMLARDGPLTRSEIAQRLRRHRIRTEGQAIAHLLWVAAAEGVICHGPNRGGQQGFALVRDWLGKRKPMGKEAALGELAFRYLVAHGPAEPADMAFWSGIRMGDARRAWKSIEGRLVEVPTMRGARWTLRSQTRRAPGGVVRLLPSFDEYLLGWKDRRPVVQAEHWRAINRGGGWLHPVIVVDGRVMGTWTAERSSKAFGLELLPFSPLPRAARRSLDREGEDLARFLGTAMRHRGSSGRSTARRA